MKHEIFMSLPGTSRSSFLNVITKCETFQSVFFLFNNVGKCAKLFTSERERQWGWKCSWIYLSATVTMSQCFFKRIFGFSFRWCFQVQVHITQVVYITSSHHWNFSFTTISNFARQSGTHLWNLQFTCYAPNIFIWKSLKSFKAIFCLSFYGV